MTGSAPAQRLALAAPAIAFTVALVLLPAVATVLMALTHFDALDAPRWAGFANFRELAADPMFNTALRNSLIVALVAVPLRIGLALALALLLNPPRRLAAPARAAIFLPGVVPDIAWAILWLWILNPLYGPMAWLLAQAGLRPDIWLLQPWAGRGAVVLIMLFLIGEVFLVLLAARREIPRELYEVASVEGASNVVMFNRLTLPLLAPAILFLAARDVALSLQTTFVPSLIVTHGGPQFATTFLPLYVYQNAFEYLRFGYAAALTCGMFAITLATMGAQILLMRRWAERGY